LTKGGKGKKGREGEGPSGEGKEAVNAPLLKTKNERRGGGGKRLSLVGKGRKVAVPLRDW